MAVKSTHAGLEKLITVASKKEKVAELSPYDFPRRLLKSTVTKEGVPLFAEDSPSAATNLMDAALLKIDLMEKGTPDPKKYKYSTAQKKRPSTQRFIADWNYVHEAEKNKNFTETYKKARKLYRQAKSETFKETGRRSLRSYDTSKKPDIDTKIELSKERDPIRESSITINLDEDTGQPATSFDRKKMRLVKERRAPEVMAEQKRLEELHRKRGRLPEYLEMLQNQYERATYDVSGRRSTEFDRRYLAPTIERIREEISNYNEGGVVKRKTKRKKKPKVTKKTYSSGSRKAKYNG